MPPLPLKLIGAPGSPCHDAMKARASLEPCISLNVPDVLWPAPSSNGPTTVLPAAVTTTTRVTAVPFVTS